MNYIEFCVEEYGGLFEEYFAGLYDDISKKSRKDSLSDGKLIEIETMAQKQAIKDTTINAMRNFPDIEPAFIWKAIYESHVHRKSGISDAETISRVISADQSWKKSSGHAFEEMVKLLATESLQDNGIDIILQRDLSEMIKNKLLNNEVRDISWLKEQIKANIFDLYAIVRIEEKQFCFGCIQSKTSIRDRVTRDREPSINAMNAYFWSVIIVLDGDFLKNDKFINMVNGGSAEFVQNGWHGMYVFSDKYTANRIFPTDISMKNFSQHAVKAADYWLTQRQWFDGNWRP